MSGITYSGRFSQDCFRRSSGCLTASRPSCKPGSGTSSAPSVVAGSPVPGEAIGATQLNVRAWFVPHIGQNLSRVPMTSPHAGHGRIVGSAGVGVCAMVDVHIPEHSICYW